MNNKRTLLVTVVSLVLFLIVIIGASYAFFSATAQIVEQSLTVTAVTPTGLIYTDGGMLTLNNAIPGDRTRVEAFTIENQNDNTIYQAYTLALYIDQNDFTSSRNPNQLLLYLGYNNCEVDEAQEVPLICDNIIELDLTDGNGEMSSNTSIEILKVLIAPGEIQDYNIYIKYVNINDSQDENRNVSFVAHIELLNPTLIKQEDLPFDDLDLDNKIIKLLMPASERTLSSLNLVAKSGTPSFSMGTESDETANGLYASADDYGTSYYFRGIANNNYVKFGKNSSNQDMWWRIIRINGDGSIRMIYDGTQAYGYKQYDSGRLAINNVAWNISGLDDNRNAGYMLSNSGYSSEYYQSDMNAPDYANSLNAVYNEIDSNIKSLVDEWYEENILNTGYANYLSDEIFCNDRSTVGTNKGYGFTYGDYGAVLRNGTNKTPSLTCPQKNDAFTVGDSNTIGNDDSTGRGNGYLKYPIGLITADEVAMAGGVFSKTNWDFYLNKGAAYYTMSPRSLSFIIPIDSQGNMSLVQSNGGSSGVAPVINLSPETARSLVGSGTTSNPYRLN